jgi:CAAX protease family protein
VTSFATTRLSRQDGLAVASVLVWSAGAAAAGRCGIWLSLGVVAVACGAILLVLDGARLVPLLRPTPAQILLGLAAGAVMAGATYALYPIAVRLVPAIAADTKRLYAAFASLSPAASAVALAPVVVGEELVWRGVVHGALSQRLGRVAAVLVGATLYASAHAPVGSLLLTFTALACGIVWSSLRAWTGSLVATLASHLLWDALVLLAFPLAATVSP